MKTTRGEIICTCNGRKIYRQEYRGKLVYTTWTEKFSGFPDGLMVCAHESLDVVKQYCLKNKPRKTA